jgi:hypothetical protein
VLVQLLFLLYIGLSRDASPPRPKQYKAVEIDDIAGFLQGFGELLEHDMYKDDEDDDKPYQDQYIQDVKYFQTLLQKMRWSKATLGGIPINDAFIREYAMLHHAILDGPPPYRVLIVDGSEAGGLGDRTSGAMSCLLLAMLTRRALVLDFPFDTWYRWVDSPYLDTRYLPKYEKYVNDSDYRELNLIDQAYIVATDLETRNYDELWPEDTLRIKINQPIVQYIYANTYYHMRIREWGLDMLEDGKYIGAPAWRKDITRIKQTCTIYDNMLGVLYRVIAKPTHYLRIRLDQFKARHFGFKATLGIHLRFGADRGAVMTDPMFGTDANKFWRCAEAYRNSTDKWFVTSDSESMLKQAYERERHRVVVVPGRPRHLAKHYPSIEQIEKIFMDHYLLAECDVVLASGSSFSRNAVYRSFYCPVLPQEDHDCTSRVIQIPRML